MDNSKRNIHSSGPLGILMKSGQIEEINELFASKSPSSQTTTKKKNASASYLKNESGFDFTDDELMYVDPKECEPWEYANRGLDEMGDIEQLIESIKTNRQLQPALVRVHPRPHDKIKYEVIFGRRRHLACLQMGIPFLVICKELSNDSDAIVQQDAENKYRQDVSNYSNAKLYKRLLKEGVFSSAKELAQALNIKLSTLNDIMAFTRLPDDILQRIPNVHIVSINLVLKLLSLLKDNENNHQFILSIAGELGVKITSPTKLISSLNKFSAQKGTEKNNSPVVFTNKQGDKLFTVKKDQRGVDILVMSKDIASKLNLDEVYEEFRKIINLKVCSLAD